MVQNQLFPLHKREANWEMLLLNTLKSNTL